MMKFKIDLVNELIPLRRRLELEGNEMVEWGADVEITHDCQNGKAGVVIGHGERFDQSSLAVMGLEVEGGVGDVTLTRWWDKRAGWGEQVYVAVPVIGLMNMNQSAQVRVGCVGCYSVQEKATVGFENTTLTGTLEMLGHHGFVTLTMDSKSGRFTELQTGVPGWGLYAMLEGVEKTVGGFLAEGGRLKESWSVSSLVSRYPYPMRRTKGDLVQIGVVEESVEKHFWFGEHQRFDKVVHTSGTLVGVASGWDWGMGAAITRVLKTCWNFRFPEVQYRTDLEWAVRGSVERGREIGLFD